MVSIVMGLDQHRAQISAEWLDTITGELSRARIAPADRAGVRKFLARFQARRAWRSRWRQRRGGGSWLRSSTPAISPAKGRRRCAGRSMKQHNARFPASPDRAYYQQLAARIGGNRACLALARKLLKRSYHILKDLGDQALAPVA